MGELHVNNSAKKKVHSGRDSTITETHSGTPNEITLRLIKNLEHIIKHLRITIEEKDERLAYIMVISKEKDESIKNLELIIKRGFKDVIESFKLINDKYK